MAVAVDSQPHEAEPNEPIGDKVMSEEVASMDEGFDDGKQDANDPIDEGEAPAEDEVESERPMDVEDDQ